MNHFERAIPPLGTIGNNCDTVLIVKGVLKVLEDIHIFKEDSYKTEH